MQSDSGDQKKSTSKKGENGAAKKAPESTGEASKASVAKQVSPTAADAVDSKLNKNATKTKPSTKASKALPVEAVEKNAWKVEQFKASEKRGVKAPKVDGTEKKIDKTDAPSATVGTTNRQTKKKQRQQQQQATTDIAVAPAVVADTSSSSKKKKAAAAEKRRNSLGATTTRQSSPSEAAPVAPPPGLAPPPGFLSTKEEDAGLPAPSADDASISNLSQIPLDGGVGVSSGLGGLGGTELWLGRNTSSPLGHDNQESLISLQNDRPLGASGNTDSLSSLGGSLPLLDQASPGFLRGRPLLGGGGGFNVQSFLDTILDESEMVEDDYEEDGGREGNVGGSPLALGSGAAANYGLADAIATATAIGDHTSDLLVPQRQFLGIGSVSNDPWSAPNISSSALPTVPLLTPEQILREKDAADAEEKNKKEEDGSHLMALFGANEDDK